MIERAFASARRAWCLALHPAEDRRPSRVGLGSLRCIHCGAGYTDLLDARRLLLDELTGEPNLSPRWLAEFSRSPQPERPTFEAGSFRVLRGGQLVKVGRFSSRAA